MSNPQSFEDFLREIHADSYTGTEEDMNKSFDDWVENLNPNFLEYLETKYFGQ